MSDFEREKKSGFREFGAGFTGTAVFLFVCLLFLPKDDMAWAIWTNLVVFSLTPLAIAMSFISDGKFWLFPTVSAIISFSLVSAINLPYAIRDGWPFWTCVDFIFKFGVFVFPVVIAFVYACTAFTSLRQYFE